MTPEQIIEDYKAALTAVVGEKVARATKVGDWSGAFIVHEAYYDLEGNLGTSGEMLIYYRPEIIAATESLRRRAAERNPPSRVLAAMDNMTQEMKDDCVLPPILQRTNGKLWGMPIAVDNSTHTGKVVFGDLSQGAEAMRTGKPIIPTSEQLVEILRGSWLDGCITQQGERWWFRFDDDGLIDAESTTKEKDEALYDIQQELGQCGYRLTDVQVEHDCISGYIERIEEQP